MAQQERLPQSFDDERERVIDELLSRSYMAVAKVPPENPAPYVLIWHKELITVPTDKLKELYEYTKLARLPERADRQVTPQEMAYAVEKLRIDYVWLNRIDEWRSKSACDAEGRPYS